MAKYLLIAEKPSVMRDIQSVYNKHRSQFKDEIEFDAFHGHLLTFVEPNKYNAKYKKWNEDDLPIIPKNFAYTETDKQSSSKIYQRIKNGNYDAIINACDAGREGEHIFFSFYEYHKLKTPVLRFWASDTTETTILAALKKLLPASQFDGLRQAAKYRAQLDWLVGINFSRAVTLASTKTVSVGRVMSPTLKIIVDREKEISKFVPDSFYELQGTFKAAAGEYLGKYLIPPDSKQSRFSKESEAKGAMSSLKKEGIVKSVEARRQSTKAPTLYSLTELQKDGNKYFGYTADKTLSIAQNLYERYKVLSYPRTESRFLPTAMVPELKKHLKPIEYTALKPFVTKITQADIDKATKGKDYVDNAKITDHHAIIPTTEMPKMAAMSTDEQNIYLLVCKRFLAIFMPPYVVNRTTIITDIDGKLFKSSGKVEVSKGFGELYTSNAKDVILPPVKKGDKVTVAKTKITKGKTSPPIRFNPATLLDAMQNAGNYVSSAESRKVLKEAAGLGTSATRASIIKNMVNYKMIELKKNAYYPTDFGQSIISIIGDRICCSPQLTADWEKKLQSIEADSYKGDFLKEMNAFITDETNRLLSETQSLLGSNREVLGQCPKCGKNVIIGNSYYLCSGYKKTCDFIIGESHYGAEVTKEDVKTILSGNVSGVKTFTRKDGGTYNGLLKIVNTKLAVLINDSGKKINSKSKCPICGGDICEGTSFFLCSNKNITGCTWAIKKTICGTKITVKDIETLVAGEETEFKSFVWKSGKPGTAALALQGGKLKFIFENRESA